MKEIKKCKDCPHFSEIKNSSTIVWFCGEDRTEIAISNVGLDDKLIPIPKWCPLKYYTEE